MFVKPAPGLVVRDPFTRVPLPVDGREVPETSYWNRRVRDGDVVLASATVAKPVAPAVPVGNQP